MLFLLPLNPIAATTVSYTGYVAYPTEYAQESEPATAPGVLIAHQWYGLGDMEMYRAEEMASTLGHVAFALDVYGTGVRATRLVVGEYTATTSYYFMLLLASPARVETL